MSDRCRARVIRVKRDKHGAVLASAASIGDTVLLVKDAGDLAVDDETPGTLLVDDDTATQLVYTDVEYVEDTDPGDLATPDTVTLSAALAVAIPADTQLWVYETPDDDPADDGIVSDYIAICVPEDDEDAAELGGRLHAAIPPHMQDDFPPGRADARVVLEFDDDTDEWTVLRFRGKARGLRFEHAEPPYTPTSAELTAGTFTRQLMHRNIAAQHGLFTTINGIALGSEWWTLDAAAGVVTVTIPDWVAEASEGYREFGWPMYAYRRGLDPVAVEGTGGGGGGPTDPVVVPLTVVGTQGIHVYTNVSNTQSIPLSTPIVSGDLIMFACIGDGGTIECPDPRMSLAVSTTFGGKLVKIWLGTDNGSGSPLDIDVHYDNPSFTCEFSMLAMVLHPTAPVAWTGLVSDQSGASGSTVPGVSGVSGAVAIAVSSVSTAGGDYGWNWPSPWGSASQQGVYRYITSAFQAGPTIGDTALSTTGGHTRRGFLLGIGMG